MKSITKLKQKLKRKKKQSGTSNDYDNDSDNNICMSESQIKTLLDEARNGNICDYARKFIDSLDKKYGNINAKSKSKSKKNKKELSFYDRIIKDWF